MTDRPGRPPWRWRRGTVVLTWRHAEGLPPELEPARPGRVVAVIESKKDGHST